MENGTENGEETQQRFAGWEIDRLQDCSLGGLPVYTTEPSASPTHILYTVATEEEINFAKDREPGIWTSCR